MKNSIYKTVMNIPKKTASFKEVGLLNGYGLRRAIDAISNNCLARSARVVLSQVCKEAASTSAFKITKSRTTMAEECGVTPATIRRNLRDVVVCRIMTETRIMDQSAKGRGQMPTEYQFTPGFLRAARAYCKIADVGNRAEILAAKVELNKAILALNNQLFNPTTPRSNLSPLPDQNDREIQEDLEYQKQKDSAADAAACEIPKPKSWAQARSERATTKAQDFAAHQQAAREARHAEQRRLTDKARRSYFAGNAAGGRRAPQTTFNASRFDAANRAHDQAFDDAVQRRNRALSEGFSPRACLEAARKKSLQNLTRKD